MRGARSRAKGGFLKSRVAITAILMLGLLTGGTGTTLALSDSTGDASQVQYPQEAPRGGDRVLGTQQGGNAGSDVRGTVQSSDEAAAVQGGQQVAATEGGSDLPFTGLAAVPLILVGLGLIVAGTMMYRSARREPSGA